MPDWYGVIAAAKYLGVAPWELLKQPVVWRDIALQAAAAEAGAKKSKAEAAKRKRDSGGVK